jgi:hypothetical protein
VPAPLRFGVPCLFGGRLPGAGEPERDRRRLQLLDRVLKLAGRASLADYQRGQVIRNEKRVAGAGM